MGLGDAFGGDGGKGHKYSAHSDAPSRPSGGKTDRPGMHDNSDAVQLDIDESLMRTGPDGLTESGEWAVMGRVCFETCAWSGQRARLSVLSHGRISAICPGLQAKSARSSSESTLCSSRPDLLLPCAPPTLVPAEAQVRLAEYGRNELEEKANPKWKILLKHCAYALNGCSV